MQTYKDAEGSLLPVPPTRTMAAIKRESEKLTRARMKSTVYSAKDRAAIRAYQYALTMTGRDAECGHSISLSFIISETVKFDRNSEGRNVPRFVDFGDDEIFEIPHWDFVPEEPRLIVERPAYRAPAHFYSSASYQLAA